MLLILCEPHNCLLVPEACASRHLNAITGKNSSSASNEKCGVFDLHCITCKEGRERLFSITIEGVENYRKMLLTIKKEAVLRTMREAKLKKGFEQWVRQNEEELT